jgi:threonyl-tRNA synthetase
MLVTGDREAAEGTVAVRGRAAGDLGARPVDSFIADALNEIRTKARQLAAPVEQQPA